jgi:hypothetical protein
MHARPVLFVGFAMALAAACGGGQSEPKTVTGPTPSASPAMSASEAASASASAPASASASAVASGWDAKSKDEKLAVMKTVVMPKMSELFKAHDAKKYKDFKCVTCHGPGVKEGKFEMPNPLLPKLDPKDGFKKHMDKAPAVTKFMITKVVPEMAAAIGEAVYDPKTKTGFGCGECHVMEK